MGRRRKRHKKRTTRIIYDNCHVYGPDNVLLHLANNKQVDFYLGRDLAEIIDTGPPISIRLKFIPNGPGHADNKFYLIPRKNICVVCGDGKKLSRHHVVPNCYRRYFPDEFKVGWAHDVLALCNKCHVHYEHKASEFKEQLAIDYNAPMHGVGFTVNEHNAKVRGRVNTYTHWGHLLPLEKRIEFEEFLKGYFEVDDLSKVTNEEWKAAADLKIHTFHDDFQSHGQLVLKHFENRLFDFIVTWRIHFVETMKPQFLPELWDIEHKSPYNVSEK